MSTLKKLIKIADTMQEKHIALCVDIENAQTEINEQIKYAEILAIQIDFLTDILDNDL